MAIKFWNFILVTTVLITLLRGGSNFFGNFFSTLPFSFFLWVGYRLARLQPWWPFGTADDSQSRFEAVAKLFSKVAPDEKLSPTIQQMARQTLASRNQKATIVAKKVTKPAFKPVAESFAHRSVPSAAKEPESFRVLSETVSNVGVRTKAVRAKVVRQKAVRSKRPTGLL